MSNTGDALVNAYADKYADNLISGTREEDIEDDDLFDELENFDDSNYRSTRLQQLSDEIKSIKSLPPDHGTYLEIRDEKEVLKITTTTDFVVCHFFHPDFERCKIMDSHLVTMATRYIRTRFIRVNVDNVPFLVTKLQIKVLPCVMPFVKGVGRDRLLGFEGLGGDGFKSAVLEAALRDREVIQNVRIGGGGGGERSAGSGGRAIMGFPDREEEFDSDE